MKRLYEQIKIEIFQTDDEFLCASPDVPVGGTGSDELPLVPLV